jgi:LmbE family N-acetylglucosaminyl deacetylase
MTMRLSFEQDRLLAVMAHPDDAELLCAGTLARAKADGAAIGIVVMCRGDKGAGSSFSGGDLARARQEEASAAAEVLGAKLFWFNAGDGELFDSYGVRKQLIELYRQFRPTLVIAHAAEDYHPDHRAASVVAEAASWFSASRGHVTESPALTSPPKLWLADTISATGGEQPDVYVDVSDHVELKKKMLSCHRSQLDRGSDADFSPLTELMLRQCQLRGAQAGVAAAEAFRWHHAFKRIGAF